MAENSYNIINKSIKNDKGTRIWNNTSFNIWRSVNYRIWIEIDMNIVFNIRDKIRDGAIESIKAELKK